jgi:hypothetical protein
MLKQEQSVTTCTCQRALLQKQKSPIAEANVPYCRSKSALTKKQKET